MRALITLSPLIYREAIAQSPSQRRPGFEVRSGYAFVLCSNDRGTKRSPNFDASKKTQI
jgi:hypothetical protein